MGSLDGKTAIVTGAGRGIGAAIATRYLDEGARVLLACRTEPPHPNDDRWTGRAVWQPTDISRASDVEALFAMARERFDGRLDVLVNNAGVQLEKTLADTSDEDWDWLCNVNIRGTFYCTRAAVRLMREAGGGVILNIGSIAGEVADYGLTIYSASKAWVHGLTRAVATDHGADGIRCNAICPSWTMTELSSELFEQAADPERARQGAIRRHPVGRLGQPEDIAAAAAWLASDDAAFASGQLFVIDGGMTAASQINPAVDFK